MNLSPFAYMPSQYVDKETLALIRERLWRRAQATEITLEDIQDRTGFSYSQVYRVVRDGNNVSVSHLVAVCRALEIQPREIFDFDILIPEYRPLRRQRR